MVKNSVQINQFSLIKLSLVNKTDHVFFKNKYIGVEGAHHQCHPTLCHPNAIERHAIYQ